MERMSRNLRTQDLAVGAVCLFILVNLLTYSSRMPLFHEEPRRAIVAQEMLMTGDYIVPTMYQVPYCKKPPFHNWLIVLTSAPGGVVTGTSARLVSIIALLATGLALYGFLRKRRPDMAFPAFLMATTTFVMACEYGSKVEPDMTLTAMTTLAVLSYLVNPVGPGWIVLSSLFMGAGILTKGISPLFFYPAAVVLLVRVGDRRAKRTAWLAVHALFSLALPAVWVWLYHRHGEIGNLFSVVSSEVSGRASRPLGEFLLHLVTFPPELFLALIPWSVVMLLAFARPAEKDDIFRMSWWIAIFSFVIFLLLPSGKNRLIMPAIPFFAVVAATYLDRDKICGPRIRIAALGILAGLAGGFAVFLAVKGYVMQPLLLGLAVVVAVLLARRPCTCLGLGAAVALLTVFVNQHGVYFYRSTYRFDYAAAAAAMVAGMEEDLPIVVDDDKNPKRIGFYLETETGRPIYSKTLPRPERFYYATLPEGGDRRTGWAMSLIETPNDLPEER